MSSVIKSKRRRPESLGYNSWIALPFPTVALAASTPVTAVSGRIPLGLNAKIVAISYVVSGIVAGAATMNIVQGVGSYETAGAASLGSVTLGGTFAVGESVTINVGSFSQTIPVTTRNAGNLFVQAANIARVLNRNTSFSALYIASSAGPVVYIQRLAYSIAANSTTLSGTVSSVSGTAVASGATLAGGVAGTLPVVAPGDSTDLGIVPFTRASAGNSLLPVDMPVRLVAEQSAMIYPGAYDSIFTNTAGPLTLRLSTAALTTGDLQVILWAVPVDAFPGQPGDSNLGFLPGLNVI